MILKKQTVNQEGPFITLKTKMKLKNKTIKKGK